MSDGRQLKQTGGCSLAKESSYPTILDIRNAKRSFDELAHRDRRGLTTRVGCHNLTRELQYTADMLAEHIHKSLLENLPSSFNRVY